MISSVPCSAGCLRRLAAVVLLLVLTHVAAAQDAAKDAAKDAAQDAAKDAPSVAATSVPAGVSVAVDSARWESGYGEKFFQVVGTVKNDSSQTAGAIRVRTELLDDAGKVVATFDSWNARAEALGDLNGDAARAELAKLAPGPVAPGTSDRFRATFLEDETPKFTGHRVRIVNVLPPA